MLILKLRKNKKAPMHSLFNIYQPRKYRHDGSDEPNRVCGSAVCAAGVHPFGKYQNRVAVLVPEQGKESCTSATHVHERGNHCRTDATPFHRQVNVSRSRATLKNISFQLKTITLNEYP